MIPDDSIISIPPDLAATLRKAKKIVVLTGSGISAESGVPTFRDAQAGLWAQYRPEELATPQAFLRNPALVWEWYEWRRDLVVKAKPNLGHDYLVIMEKQAPEFVLITQNVDGLHQQAGSQNVIELHGNIHRNKCSREGTIMEISPPAGEIPPRCKNCGAYLRPDVVWFNESLPPYAIQFAWEAAQNCDIFFSIGTSSLVQPAASLPMIAHERGAAVVEINIAETPLSTYATFALTGSAGQILQNLVKRTWQDPLQPVFDPDYNF